MTYSGVHFKTCPIEFRESFHIISNAEVVRDCIYKVTKQNLEFVNIGTCNRFDICIFGKVTKSQVMEIFCSLSNTIKNSELDKYLHIYLDFEALSHLFKVTSSLDSLVIGESRLDVTLKR